VVNSSLWLSTRDSAENRHYAKRLITALQHSRQ